MYIIWVDITDWLAMEYVPSHGSMVRDEGILKEFSLLDTNKL